MNWNEYIKKELINHEINLKKFFKPEVIAEKLKAKKIELEKCRDFYLNKPKSRPFTRPNKQTVGFEEWTKTLYIKD